MAGPVQGPSTEALCIDAHLPAGGHYAQDLSPGHSGFVQAPDHRLRRRFPQLAGVLSVGNRVDIGAADGTARFLLLAERPLGEPVVQ